MTAKDVVSSVFKAYADRDLDAVLSHFADDACFHWRADPGQIPFAGPCHGKASIAERLRGLAEQFEFDAYEPELLIGEGDRAASVINVKLTRRADGAKIALQAGQFWTVKDGKVSELVEFYDTAMMADWMARMG